MLSIQRDSRSVEDLPYELVERKGVGHPDTMCDAIAERMSRYYSLHCLKEFGGVAHHWFDKVTLYGGGADTDYGRGELTSPYRVMVFGKAAFRVGAAEIPVQELVFRAAADVLAEVTTGFDATRHLVVELGVVDHQGSGRGRSRYQPASLRDLVPLRAQGLVSNDTNLLHGYAPLSRLESVVLGLEHLVNGAAFKRRHPDSGWDVKVFGSRRQDAFSLVVNMPFLAAHIESMDHYLARKAVVRAELDAYIASLGIHDVRLLMNATDRNGRPYLTALGSVADTGDVGVVGRGNRVNGLITPMRPMSIEAPAGKNPLDHTGKIYNVMAARLARQVHEEFGGPAQVHIFTSKEAPLEHPDEVVVTTPDADEPALRALVEATVASSADLTVELIEKGITLW
ncbi:methionine adenosyltransferase [Streptomyces subrutilus]|uniref:S-adenosylmethionine synthetase n=1 Tax=Streptomyces subrutilus TaxID=36818 RepID=A0A5P2UFK4_9ACTN|nr:methionine adenosyltransferase [Streptomyces subrutilus]QEU77750.1 S-adenosylmethionine synthetase [Streptomyces subrutilus]WSJ33142.1 methionine adenosyltransferase [Streptomyces subrutilus]GGZ61838.1 S-adenosylmethionine synthetase [Streptomyces subrutilus]